MDKHPKGASKEQSAPSKKSAAILTGETLHQQAFDSSFQPNIITIVGSGKIILANSAACKLLGYSGKQILTKKRYAIFDVNESSFKNMLKQRMAHGHSIAYVTVIKKSGKTITCKITSAIFVGEDGIEKAITTITDMSQSIMMQKLIDVKKEKVVADNIILAQAKSDSRMEENNEWIKYIAKSSYDVMWDWDIATDKIYVGDSIEEVFGYKAENDTADFTDFQQCLLPEEKDAVKKKLFKAISSRKKSWNDSYMFKRRDGSVASTISRASIVRDEKGKAIRLIGAIQDVSRVLELEQKVNEQEDKFLLTAKLSFDIIWDWNLLTDEVFRGEGYEELFGYILEYGKGNIADWKKHIHPDDKEAVEKGIQESVTSSAEYWEDVYRFIKADGSIAKVYDRASIIRDADGKACRMIGVMHDLSRINELEEKLENEIANKEELVREFKENFKLIFNSSSEVLYDTDLVTNKVLISDAYEKEFGYPITNNMTPADDWLSHIHPTDKAALSQDFTRAIESEDTEWKYSYRFLKADNSVANVTSNAIILRNIAGKAYRMIGSMHDISKEKVLEEKLEHEIRLKEKQIADATLDARDTERSDIGKELHDNINQLLGASRMYLQMAKRGGVNSEMYLSRSSEYTLNAIEEIRKLTKGLTTDTIKNLGLAEAIENIVQDTMETNSIKISCSLEGFKEQNINEKFKLNIFRIVQEQLNNILKHAKATKIAISLLQNENAISLTVSDNGIGFDTAKKRIGIGVDNIKSRAASYNGTADFVSKPGKGCILSVTFPVAAA